MSKKKSNAPAAPDETAETTVDELVDEDPQNSTEGADTADTEAPPPETSRPAMARRRQADPPVDRRLGTRPTPYERAQAWAEDSAEENARQRADQRAADVREGERLLALSRGEPWPPEPAS